MSSAFKKKFPQNSQITKGSAIIKIAVSSTGQTFDDAVETRFGRCCGLPKKNQGKNV